MVIKKRKNILIITKSKLLKMNLSNFRTVDKDNYFLPPIKNRDVFLALDISSSSSNQPYTYMIRISRQNQRNNNFINIVDTNINT